MFAWFLRLLDGNPPPPLQPSAPTHIVVLEPSLLRDDETYILGPFSFMEAKEVATREIEQNPYGRVTVRDRHLPVFFGDVIARPADPPGDFTGTVIRTRSDYWRAL